MNFEEIYKAAKDGRTFRFIGKINELSYENGNLKIDWLFPEAGKPFNLNHDFTYIELAPKYDPCRPFKKGDIVEPVACNGRAPLYLRKYIGTKQVVECDEDINGIVGIVGDVEAVSAAFLKLITPIEELKPYSVVELSNGDYAVYKGDERLCVFRDGELVTPVEELSPYYVKETASVYEVFNRNENNSSVAIFFKSQYSIEKAKERAEAERDRLNAEHRKEMV